MSSNNNEIKKTLFAGRNNKLKYIILTIFIVSIVLISIFFISSLNKEVKSGVVDHKVIGARTSDTSQSVLMIIDEGVTSCFNEDVRDLFQKNDTTPVITKSIEEEIIEIYGYDHLYYGVNIRLSDGSETRQFSTNRQEFNNMMVGESVKFEAYNYNPYEITKIFED